MSDSIITFCSSTMPSAPAALIIEYSPETCTSKRKRTAGLVLRVWGA
jgi:hypothetical protein